MKRVHLILIAVFMAAALLFTAACENGRPELVSVKPGFAQYYVLGQSPDFSDGSWAFEVTDSGGQSYDVQVTPDDYSTDFDGEQAGEYELTLDYPGHRFVIPLYVLDAAELIINAPAGVVIQPASEEETTVSFTEDFSFYASVAEGYELSEDGLSLSLGGKLLADPQEQDEALLYTVSAQWLTENVRLSAQGKFNAQFSATGVQVKTYAVTVENTALPEGAFTVDAQATAEHHSILSFTVTAAEGYTQSAPSVSYSISGGEPQELVPVSGVYDIEVTGAVKIYVQGEYELNTYTAQLSGGDGYTAQSASQEITHGDSFAFTVELETGYDRSDIAVYYTMGGGDRLAAPGTDGQYTIEDVRGDLDIAVEDVTLNIYGVEFDQNEGYDVIDMVETAEHGQSYSFKLQLWASHSKSTIEVSYSVGESAAAVLTADNDGVYTVENVTGDLYITVEDLEENTYTVTLPEGTGFAAAFTEGYSGTVIHDYSAKFTVTLSEGYTQSQDTLKVYAAAGEGDAVEITADEHGNYMLDNVTADMTITVSGVSINTYTAALSGEQDGFTFAYAEGYSATAEHGASVKFSVTVLASHSQSAAQLKVEYAFGGETVTLTAIDGVYTIENVTGGIDIVVSGLTKNTYAVTLPQEPVGYTVTAEEQQTEVTHGDSYKFSVTVDTAYDRSQYTVEYMLGASDWQALTAGEGGVYTVADVTAAVTVRVTGVQRNIYAVTLPADTVGYEISSEQQGGVSHGADYVFSINVLASHSQSQTVVKVSVGGGAEQVITPDAESKLYTVSALADDIQIFVYGVEINTYDITVPESVPGSGFTYAVQGGGANTVNYGASYSFTVTVQGSHSQSAANLKVEYSTDGGENYTVLTAVDGVYTVANVTTGIKISVSGLVVNEYTATADSGEGYQVALTNEGKVNHGGTYKFLVIIKKPYSKSPVTVKYSVGGGELIDITNDGVPVSDYQDYTGGVKEYTLTDVTGNVNIYIDGVTLNSYKVQIKYSNDAPSFSWTLMHGESKQINVQPQDGKQIEDYDFFYIVDGEEVALTDEGAVAISADGTITFTEIAQDYVIVMRLKP